MSIKDPKGMGDFLHIVLAIFAVGVMISFLLPLLDWKGEVEMSNQNQNKK